MDWIPPEGYLNMYEEYIKWILNNINLCRDWIKPIRVLKIIKYMSPSHNGIHFIIKLTEELTDEEKLRLQFLLGDDRKRCRMNWQSIQLGMSDWNKLYISNRYKKID